MRRIITAFFACLLPLAAQTTSLQGNVTDPQQASIAGAVVSITNQDTAAGRSALSDDTGKYTFLQLAPGSYKVGVQKPGFSSYQSDIRLQVSTPATLNIQLEIGQTTETVNVMADAVQVNTQNATVGNPFTETQVRQLPLQTRNVVELLSLQPGVTPTGEVLGGKKDQNNITLDGVDVNDNQTGGLTSAAGAGFNAALPVPLDSVQEFRTTVAGQGSDQGRSSGGQVSLVTKGGSNQFHGSAYEYTRNVKTAANNWFSNRAGLARENLIRNQYGASIGGRMVRDRAFFFLNWEDRKDRTASATTRVVPSETFKQGIVTVLLTNGRTVGLTPADITAIDPLKTGTSSYMLNYLKAYPAGNDPLSSADRGLNYSVLRFNAPRTINNRVYVGRMDFNIDKAGNHQLMVRGTLNKALQDLTLAQFPGQDAASKQIDNTRNLALRYTSVLSPSVVNVASWGYTRIGVASTGTDTVVPTFFTAAPVGTARASQRISPTTNVVDDVTWSKGRHTVQAGVNIRFIQNDRLSFNNLPNYSFSRNTLRGLGADITGAVTSYLASNYGGGTLSSGQNVTNAMGTLLGLLNQFGATYNFGVDGKAIPFGTPVTRSFKNNEYELYVSDSYRIKPTLTLNYGIRYSIFGVPYEKNGVQVEPITALSQYFADRAGGQALGVPSYVNATSSISYKLGGPLNNGKGYYPLDKNNFAPRFGFAWAPEGGMAGNIFGKGSAIRGSFGVVFDHYGGNMAVNFANSGSPGLATTVSQPVNTDFTTAFRYTGGGVPTIPAAPGGGFPFTPPTIVGGFTSFTGISSNLVAPYSYLLNLTYARPLPKNLSIEVGYVGRLSQKSLLTQDIGQPLTNYKDQKSGTTWTQASGVLRAAYDSGITPAQVRANPSILPAVPFVENMFGKAANTTFPGSATANYFYSVYNTYAGSDLDALNDMDRLRLSNGTCISLYGCNTFFANQAAGINSYTNVGRGAFHGATLVLRRGVSRGWGFDFNYTMSHSIDNSSGTEGGGGLGIQDAFSPNSFKGSSDFDIRHNMTSNFVVELPFGKGRKFLGGSNKYLDGVIGGWQVSALGSYRSGTPLSISNGGVYPTNYLSSAIAILKPGATMPTNARYDQTGAPSVFTSTTAVNSFIGQYPGTVGNRNIVRRPAFFNTDLSIAKSFKLPIEGHRIQVRGEAFNSFNNVNFTGTPQLSLATPATFGQITSAADARVMQFALRYEF